LIGHTIAVHNGREHIAIFINFKGKQLPIEIEADGEVNTD
jgi:hypothetical protein